MNGHARVENGRTLYPHMHGDEGWYDYRPARYEHGVLELYYWSMREEDRRRGLEARADYYLTKGSFHDETLLQAVVDLIGEAQAS